MCCVDLMGTEKVEMLTVPRMKQLIILKILTVCGTSIMVGKVNMHHSEASSHVSTAPSAPGFLFAYGESIIWRQELSAKVLYKGQGYILCCINNSLFQDVERGAESQQNTLTTAH